MIPVGNQNIFEGLFLLLTIIIIFLRHISSGNKPLYELKELIIYIYMLLTVVLILIISDNTKVYLISNLLYLIAIIHFFYKDNINLDDKKINKFLNLIYFIMCLSLLCQFYFYFSNKTDIWHLYTTWDKNYSGVVLFLFFLFCSKNNYKFGKILVLLSALLLGSRGFILMVILFYFTKFFNKKIFKVKNLLIFKRIFRVFILMFAFTYIFSFFWVNDIASNNVKEYQEGINDSSNKMRFLANIKTFDLLKEDKNLMFYGYDNDLKGLLGIDSESYTEHSTYGGLRLVQTHNSLLNIIIKTGILFSILYLLVVGKIIDKYYTLENIPFILPFLVNSMIMHSLLNGGLFLFWILILHMPQRKDKIAFSTFN